MTLPEYKVCVLRETPLPQNDCSSPEQAVEFIRQHAMTSALWREDVENFGVLFVSVRRRVRGYSIVSSGGLDTVCVHPREVFKAAILASAHAVVMFHNHPSGDPIPSEADIRLTRDMMRAGQLLKIEVLDHLIVGYPLPGQARDWVSLKELGYFYT